MGGRKRIVEFSSKVYGLTVINSDVAEQLSLLVVTSCTDSKAVSHPRQLVKADFADHARLGRRERELRAWSRPALEMYTGPQNMEVRAGLRILESVKPSSISVRIISAGYGVLEPDRPIVPYNVTFHGMPKFELVRWSDELAIPGALRKAISGWPLVLFLLGEDYLQAIRPAIKFEGMQKLLFLAKSSMAPVLTASGGVVVTCGKPLDEIDGRYISQKGTAFRLFAQALAKDKLETFNRVLTDATPRAFLEAIHREALIAAPGIN